jgi:hypothetical protein
MAQEGKRSAHNNYLQAAGERGSVLGKQECRIALITKKINFEEGYTYNDHCKTSDAKGTTHCWGQIGLELKDVTQPLSAAKRLSGWYFLLMASRPPWKSGL